MEFSDNASVGSGDISIHLPPRQGAHVTAMIERLQLAAEPEHTPSMQHHQGGSVLKGAAAFEVQAKGKCAKKRHDV